MRRPVWGQIPKLPPLSLLKASKDGKGAIRVIRSTHVSLSVGVPKGFFDAENGDRDRLS
jgi:hypothetical protein